MTKLAVDTRVQLLALFEPFTHSTGAAVSGNRPGEVFAGMQAVVLPGENKRPTIFVQYLRRLYASPAPELDLGTFEQDATILLSDTLDGFHFDMNGLVMEQRTIRPGCEERSLLKHSRYPIRSARLPCRVSYGISRSR